MKNFIVYFNICLVFALTVFFIFKYIGDCPPRIDSSKVSTTHNTKDSPENEIIKNAVTGNVFSGMPIREEYEFDKSLTGMSGYDFESLETCSTQIVGVVTTLNLKSRCIQEISSVLPVVVVGDETTMKPDVAENNVVYLDIHLQDKLYDTLSYSIPRNNFARKSLGYLYALFNMSACYILDFDDDNCLSHDARKTLQNMNINNKKILWTSSPDCVVNPYLLYGASTFIWPRGYPLDSISKHLWPRLLSLNESVVVDKADYEIDIVQFMQSVDPDVDAVWRLINSELFLPMKWTLSSTINQYWLAIHPLCVSPFNAQSTLLSRRIAFFSYLPWTVHGRVSDIWRSFIMQIMTMSFKPKPGVLAFSGDMFDHNRNVHNYMADFDGEIQLYEQTRAFVEFVIQSKNTLLYAPNTTFNSISMYIDTINELYTRGFIELGDVKSVELWCMQLLNALNLKERSAYVGHDLNYDIWLEDEVIKQDITCVLHINHHHISNLPIWMAIHSHKFKDISRVKVYVPGLNPCLGLSGIDVNCISTDSVGYFAYESIVHTIQYWGHEIEQGVLFVHDDVAWKTFSNMDLSKSFTSEILIAFSEWMWRHLEIGLPAMNKVKAEANIDIKLYSDNDVWSGQSDVFYIAKQHMQHFKEVGTIMRKYSLFLEIAVPSIFKSFPDDTQYHDRLQLFTSWGDTRQDLTYFLNHGCTSLFKCAHPMKLGFVNGIESHASCAHFLS